MARPRTPMPTAAIARVETTIASSLCRTYRPSDRIGLARAARDRRNIPGATPLYWPAPLADPSKRGAAPEEEDFGRHSAPKGPRGQGEPRVADFDDFDRSTARGDRETRQGRRPE